MDPTASDVKPGLLTDDEIIKKLRSPQGLSNQHLTYNEVTKAYRLRNDTTTDDRQTTVNQRHVDPDRIIITFRDPETQETHERTLTDVLDDGTSTNDDDQDCIVDQINITTPLTFDITYGEVLYYDEETDTIHDQPVADIEEVGTLIDDCGDQMRMIGIRIN